MFIDDSDVFYAEKSIPWVLVTLTCICYDIGPRSYATVGKFKNPLLVMIIVVSDNV